MRNTFFLVALIITAGGCVPKDGGTGPADSGVLIATKDELKPEVLKPFPAVLDLAGTRVDVQVEPKKVGNDYTLDLVAWGQIFETERYMSDDRSFSLAEAAGDLYVPPIPLVTYGTRTGSNAIWEGKMTSGDVPHSAKATISTSTETLFVGETSIRDVLKVDIALEMDSGTKEPAKRKLTFWIAKDRGVVQRTFGNSRRSPQEK